MIRFSESAPFSPISYSYEIDNILYKKKSQYQEIIVVENPYFGKIMLLDNVVQVTERDEFFYHEMLTHIAMHTHPNPKNIVVIGGGDGGTVREVLRHDCVERVYFIEIDKEVINTAKEYFPTIAGAVDDLRVLIKPMDGALFVKEVKDIDVLIVDSTDIIGFAESLFSDEFFRAVKGCLTKNGIFVTHTESLHFHKKMVIEMQHRLKGIFPIVDLYTTPLATYPGNWWAFAIASLSLNPRVYSRPCVSGTRYYDSEIHGQCFLTKGFYDKLINNRLDW
ncbi:MAG: polyamine aminopropyltransferase [Nitrospirae bacterium]|nr:polyamine aminopropyltransferase [Nitrospirota bacterium]MBF0541951.1 polyamine aminopropyltransferase [Nitrospirota bacterium]